MIRVVNIGDRADLKLKEGEKLIRVDRMNTILGNKFYMKHEAMRDIVCDRYEDWLKEQIKNNNPEVVNELDRIVKIARETDIALGCWCYPKRCHASSVKRALEDRLLEVRHEEIKQKGDASYDRSFLPG